MKKIILIAIALIGSHGFAQQRLTITNNSSYTFEAGQINTYQRITPTYTECPERNHYYYGSVESFDVPPGESRGFGNPNPGDNFPFHNSLSSYVQNWSKWTIAPGNPCSRSFTFVTSLEAWQSPTRVQDFNNIKFGIKNASGATIMSGNIGTGVITGANSSGFPTSIAGVVNITYTQVITGTLTEHKVLITN